MTSRRIATLLFGTALVLWSGAVARDRFDSFIAETILPPITLATSVEVVDRNGDLLRAYTVDDGRWRMHVDVDQVDPNYIKMLVNYEDKRFFQHSGVDLISLGRAVLQYARNGRIVSGGSTLTMQVARLLEDSGTGRMSGKLRQIRVALALEQRLSKDQILGLYMHLAPFGGNLEGVRAATFAYFGKEPKRLTAAEAALLVAIPQAPESRRPDRSHSAAVAARARVLARAIKDGVIDAEAATGTETEPVPHQRRPFPALAPHLSDRAITDAPDLLRHELTIDARTQRAMEQLAQSVVEQGSDKLQIAILVADHKSGEILVSVGSSAFQDDSRAGFVDMTQAIRSPGSTLKPLIYALAFDQGMAHPETLIDDRPMSFQGYAPQNFDRQYRGTVRVREALQLSLNIPVVQVLDSLGPAKLLAALEKAGVKAVIPGHQAGLAIGLGGIGVTLQDMVQLYAGLARGGVNRPLFWRIDGDHPLGQRLVSDISAWMVGDILAGLAPPPGAPANRLAYKTGTSYGNRDAWAIGFDGRHVIGVWLGRADGTPVPGAFGADTAAPALFQAFARLKSRMDPRPPAPSATLLVSNAELPAPLQRFRPRGGDLDLVSNVPTVVFPPDGAEVERLPEGLAVKVQGGKAPFTWLANGKPVLINQRDRSLLLPETGTGFITLSVIDAQGRSARTRVWLK